MPWGNGGFGSGGFGASFDHADTGYSSHGTGWGGSGFSSGSHRESFGSGGWSSNDRHEDGPTDPQGTHSNKCIACNVTGWSNGGLMKVHYDETCPGCRHERSRIGLGSEGFGGTQYSNLEIAGFGMVYPVGKVSCLDEKEEKQMFISEDDLAMDEPVPQVEKSMFAKLRETLRAPPTAPPAIPTAYVNQKPRPLSRRERVLHGKERRDRSRDEDRGDSTVDKAVKDNHNINTVEDCGSIEITDAESLAKQMTPPPSYESCKPVSSTKIVKEPKAQLTKPTSVTGKSQMEAHKSKPTADKPPAEAEKTQKGRVTSGKLRRFKSLWRDDVPQFTGCQSLWNAADRPRTSPTVARASLFG